MPSSAYALAGNVTRCMEFAMPWLVVPPALASLCALSIKAYKEKQLVQSLPLLAS